jgi:hypothetical protein
MYCTTYVFKKILVLPKFTRRIHLAGIDIDRFGRAFFQYVTQVPVPLKKTEKRCSVGLLRWYSNVHQHVTFKGLLWASVSVYFLHVLCWDGGGSAVAFFILSLNLPMVLFPRWGHLAPTCPDTIGCFPYFEQDPFILDTLPDVFIAGNQVRWKFLMLVKYFWQFFSSRSVSASVFGLTQIRVPFGLFR